jgi:hypothetical protein
MGLSRGQDSQLIGRQCTTTEIQPIQEWRHGSERRQHCLATVTAQRLERLPREAKCAASLVRAALRESADVVGADGAAGAISTEEGGLIVARAAFTALMIITTPALSLSLLLLVRHCCSTLPVTHTLRLLQLVRPLSSALTGVCAPRSSLLICQRVHPSTSGGRDSDITHISVVESEEEEEEAEGGWKDEEKKREAAFERVRTAPPLRVGVGVRQHSIHRLRLTAQSLSMRWVTAAENGRH